MKKKIIMLTPDRVSFNAMIEKDLLSENYDVDLFGFDECKRPRFLTAPFVTFSKLYRTKYDLVILRFAMPKYTLSQAIVAKIFRKKIVVVTGGDDVANIPSINWGEMRFWYNRVLQRLGFAFVDHILAFSEFSKNDIKKYATHKKISVLYFEIDNDVFKPCINKEDCIVTTCFIVNSSTIVQKGLNTFLECAKSFPDIKFIIIGRLDKTDAAVISFVNKKPDNLFFTEKNVTQDELIKYYQKSKLYLQLSAHEGFGIATAEAMACGCVPVGTLNTSLPEVIGDAGYLVEYGNIPQTVEAINKALNNLSLSEKARDRVVNRFGPGTRKNPLLAIVEKYID